MITVEICSFVYEAITENNTRPKTKGVQVDAGSIVERGKIVYNYCKYYHLFIRRCTANGRFYASKWIGVTKRNDIYSL